MLHKLTHLIGKAFNSKIGTLPWCDWYSFWFVGKDDWCSSVFCLCATHIVPLYLQDSSTFILQHHLLGYGVLCEDLIKVNFSDVVWLLHHKWKATSSALDHYVDGCHFIVFNYTLNLLCKCHGIIRKCRNTNLRRTIRFNDNTCRFNNKNALILYCLLNFFFMLFLLLLL